MSKYLIKEIHSNCKVSNYLNGHNEIIVYILPSLGFLF